MRIRNYVALNMGPIRNRDVQKFYGAHGAARAALDEGKPIHQVLGIAHDRVDQLLAAIHSQPLSLDAPVDSPHGGVTTVGDLMPSWLPTPEEAVMSGDEKAKEARAVYAALALLEPRERMILERRLMLDTPQTLDEIGNDLDISRERVRQLEAAAKRRLAKLLKLAAPGFGAEVEWTAESSEWRYRAREHRYGGKKRAKRTGASRGAGRPRRVVTAESA